MISLKEINKISDYEWEIPTTYRSDMRVPVRIIITKKLLEAAIGDLSIEQAVNATTLPGVVDHVVVMPDMHQGYGFPIGGVAATRLTDGVISPGGIGYDINCGVRLLASHITFEEAQPYLHKLAAALNRNCPSGVGSKGNIHLTESELSQVCIQGAKWALRKGMASEQDLRRTEENGCIAGADPKTISSRAKERGRPQLGTLGSGNHFIEVDVVQQVFDEESASTMGLSEGNLVVMIHCGSRSFGHQICSDYVRNLQEVVHEYGIKLPDRELVCAPLNSPEGKDYLSAMRAAANYAFCNRQILAHGARIAFEETFAGVLQHFQLYQVYDIAHNIGKIEKHIVDGKPMDVCVHRKGATRAFGPGAIGLPAEFSKIGQPVLVPGSMGTSSWVLTGTEESMKKTLGSSCHGAGRTLSRSQAKKQVQGENLLRQLEKQGVLILAGSMPGLAEEAPQAYKDVDQVVETVVGAGIARKTARLSPVVVIKG